MATTPSPPGLRSRAWPVVGWCAAAVFVLLALQLVTHGVLPTRIDPAVTGWLAARRTPGWTAAMRAVTAWHSTVGIDLMLAACAAWLVLGLRRHADALWLVLTVQGAMLANVALKHLFARPRPALDAPLVHLSTYSFPSGHSVASMAFWCAAAFLLPRRWRLRGLCAAVALALLVAFSRVYLGAHYLSDVAAGQALALACVSGSLLLRSRTARC